MGEQTIVVIGGALSGPTAAARAREINERARIVLVERGRRVSYALCGLAYHLSGEVAALDDLDRERADFFQAVYGVEVRTGAEVVAIDAAAKTVTVTGDAGEETLGYDALIYALGAESLMPHNLEIEPANLVCFRTLDDLESLEGCIAAGKKRIAVLGGGVMGVEAVDGLIRRGCEVTLIEQGDRLLPQFPLLAAAAAHSALAKKTRIITGATVASFETDQTDVTALSLSNGERVETDFVIATMGLKPRTALLEAAGAATAPDGTLIIDERAQTSLPDVYACGVCVSVPQVVTGSPAWYPQGALADKTATVAGTNAAGGDALLGHALGSMLIRSFVLTIGRTGLSPAEATAFAGEKNVGVTTVFAPSHERYYPESSLMLVTLYWNRQDGRLLGMTAAGQRGVDKRVDVAGVAIAGGRTIEQVAAMDLGFAPPFNAARDPLNVAAAVAAMERAGLGRLIESEDLAPRLASVQLVDVRPEGLPGYPPIAGSVMIPLESIRERLGELEKSRPVVVVSQVGRRGWLAVRILQQHGFSDVAALAGGLQAWALGGFGAGEGK